jgi:hypothetical protein
MNYCQITINGKILGLKFGMMSARLFFEALEKKVLMYGDTLNELGIAYVLWYGYLNNCEVKGVDPEYPFEMFYDFVEQNAGGNEEITAALKKWSETKPIQDAIKIAEEAKKKSIGKKSKS